MMIRSRADVAETVGDEVDEDELSASAVSLVVSATDVTNADGDVEAAVAPLSASGEASDLGAIRRLLKGSEPITWVFTGDSITHGAEHTQGRRSYTEHFAERVRWELRRFLDVVINTGVVGERSRGLLKNLEWRTKRFRPDVVSVMIGMNDAQTGPEGRAEFRQNLRAIVQQIRGDGILLLLHTPNGIDVELKTSHADLRAYVGIVRETAREFDVACIDHWAHWKKARSDSRQTDGWLTADGIHPGVYGHREIAKLIFARLGIFDGHSPTCAAHVP